MAKHGESFGSSGMCPHKRGFCNSGAGLEGFTAFSSDHTRYELNGAHLVWHTLVC